MTAKKNLANKKFIHIKEIIEKQMIPMLSYTQIHKMCQRKEIPHFRFGSKYFMTQEQIDSYIEASERIPTSK